MAWGFESPPRTTHTYCIHRRACTWRSQSKPSKNCERRITLTLAADTISGEVETRLKKLSRTVKADGFRPGKVPMSVVAQRYGYSVQYEVMNDKVGEAFNSAANEAKLRVAGMPKITQKDERAGRPDGLRRHLRGLPRGEDRRPVAGVEVERMSTEVTEAAIDKTVDILRKQRRTFAQRPAGRGRGRRRPRDDRLRRQDRRRAVRRRQGRGLPVHHRRRPDAASSSTRRVRGMKAGESKTFPLQFPADYQGKDVAGKEADFLVTMKKIEAQHLPEVERGLRQGARHRRRHRRGAARRRQEEPRARGEVPRAGAQQGGRDGRAGRRGRARRAEGAGRQARSSAWSRRPAPT